MGACEQDRPAISTASTHSANDCCTPVDRLEVDADAHRVSRPPPSRITSSKFRSCTCVCARLERLEPDSDLIDFQAEPACWRSYQTYASGAVTLKPDAFVRLGVGLFEQVSFVEVDRSTEHTPTLKRKLSSYIEAFRAGVEQQEGLAFPQVVWIVPDQPRAAMLDGLIARLPPEQQTLFVVCTEINQLHTLKGGDQS